MTTSFRGVQSMRTRGTTLVELMVAILAVSVILVGFTAIFKSLINVWASGYNKADLTQNLSVAALRLTSELRSAIPPYEQDYANEINFIGLDTPSNSTPLAASKEDEIKFHTPAYGAEEGQIDTYANEMIRTYYWVRNGDYHRLQICTKNTGYADTIYSIGTTANDGSQNPFASNVKVFQVEYKDTVGTWRTTWNAQNNNCLPKLVRITMKAASGADTKTLSLIIRPHAQRNRITTGISGT